MARARKSLRRRKQSGRLAQALEDPRGLALAIRVRRHALARATDPLLGTPVGRLFLMREIEPPQYDAAAKLMALRAAADHARALPRRSASTLDLGAVRGRVLAVLEEAGNERTIVAACDAAETAIGDRRTLSAVHECVILQREPAGHEQRLALKQGLERLAQHWRLRG